MSHPPPSDPTRPLPPEPPSGQPWSSPTGDALAAQPLTPPSTPQSVPPSVPPGEEPTALQHSPAPPAPPAPGVPQYQPGYASLPEMPASAPPDGYPPTSQFPAVGQTQYQPEYAPPAGYGPPPGYGPPGYGAPPPPAPKRSNTPLVAVLVAVTLLLCAGGITSAVLLVNRATDKAKETIESLPDVPEVPDLPTNAPALPTDLPGLPTDLPELPTDLPTGIPQLPGTGEEIEVEYKVTGDGPVEIVYMGELGKEPKRVRNASLPWHKKVKLRGSSLVSVVAVRGSTSEGTISCSATVDGEEVAQKTASGGNFTTASCTKVIF
ncbi:MmpS family transport accessory protein [Couchioplanes azureus]|uniref:MmpS family transport accessory protein n=1 Tax=Couchioplanes caeruleus TaxID=56438 RepID=UPI00166FE3F9|nr:MmpS family transport accessory protein [Couchioplanes caeruleus]GGQ66323.1 hypothetical protein GCM10010166_40120 [Couchioplanes caeruleus subsp. azureus]